MTEITPFEERLAYTPLTGVCVPRIRLFTSKGWTYHIDHLDWLAEHQEKVTK